MTIGDHGLVPRRSDRRPSLRRPRTPAGVDAAAMLAMHEATRALLDALTPEDIVEAVIVFVREVGGSVVPARLADADALPFDLSFGIAEPLLPVAPATNVARMHLETLLPTLLEDARRSMMALRQKSLLRDEATRDHLTGLLNRRTLDQRLGQLRAGAAVALVDLDHFKRLNDGEGHAAGDAVLVAFGRVIRRHLRNDDIAGRYGGEEFVVALPDAAAAALRIRLVDIGRSWVAVRPFPVSFSAGVSVVSTSGGEALVAADQALYRAKSLGRNRIEMSSG